jgi:hypothetical protein
MLCCNHLKKDICKELNKFKINVDRELKEQILKDIFGVNGDRDGSLIASKDENEYKKREGELLNEWRVNLNDGQKFVDYFLKYKSDQICKHVVAPNQKSNDKLIIEDFFKVNAVLDYITTNEVESMNHVFKALKKNKISRWSFSAIFHFFSNWQSLKNML